MLLVRGSLRINAQGLDLIQYRTHHCVQLYSLRYRQPPRNSLSRIYVLDWNVCFYPLHTLILLANFPFRWSLVMHWLLAITNSCNGLKYVTRFSCDIFGFYVACIYLQKGIQVLTRQWASVGETSAYLAIMVALLVLMAAWVIGELGNSNLFQRYVRKFLEDYGTPLVIIFFTGFVHFGHMRDVDVAVLPTSKSFFPTLDRPWLVHFWNIDVGDIFLAIPFALLLTILFYFDHNGRYISRTIIPVSRLTYTSFIPYCSGH